MKIRTKFFLFLLPVHLAAVVLAFFVFRDKQFFFILAEAAVIASFLLCLRVFRSVSEPLHLLLSGIDAIKDKDFNVKFIRTGKYETDQLIGVYNEMIDRLREERTRQEQQHFFLDKLIQTSPTGIIILDFDGLITELNPKARELLSLAMEAPILGRSIADIDHPIARVAAALSSGETQTVHIQGLETYKCRKAHFIDRGFARPFIMVEELTGEILRAEKNAYSKIIRMMAHEVNNTIGAINSILNATLSYADRLSEEEGREFWEAQTVCIERNDRLNRFMRNFADIVRLPAPHREPYPLDRLLRDIARLMEGQAAERQIAVSTELPGHPVYAGIDVQQMELVLVNAVKNSMDSIDRGGEIHLVLREKPLAILIRDNGPGIPPELEEKLFSPFFTTKKEGQGVGLTLSREILHNHGFSFSLQTKPDGWTEFRIVI
jgi:two-component system, NtrC family, nitrogen regulation sensor histidine kinase NtrY